MGVWSDTSFPICQRTRVHTADYSIRCVITMDCVKIAGVTTYAPYLEMRGFEPLTYCVQGNCSPS